MKTARQGTLVDEAPGTGIRGGLRARPAVIVGWIALALTAVATIFLPPSPIGIVAAATAVVGLSRDPRLGVLPAAILVILAIPYDRAANSFLLRIADIPVRPQDVAVGLALLLSLPRIRPGNLRRGGLAPFALLLGIGVVALGWGVLEGNAARDVLRDARWWFLYVAAVVILLTGVERPAIVRGMLGGLTVYAVLIVVAVVLPLFDQGLKERAMAFDWGLLRMQFGNSAFLPIAIAYATHALLREVTVRRAAWLALLGSAAVLSLTRTLILDLALVAGLVVLLWAWPRRRSLRAVTGRAVAIAGVGGLALVLGLGLNLVGTTATRWLVNPPAVEQPDTVRVQGSGENVVGRLLLQNPESGADSIGKRFETYRRAIAIIAANPAAGGGMGALVTADYRFGGEAFGTEGMLPNVDNAWLTVGMKAGIPGILSLLVVIAWPLLRLRHRTARRLAGWYVPAWLGLVALMMTQSFASTGYGPFVLAAFLVLLEPRARGYAARRTSAARAQE